MPDKLENSKEDPRESESGQHDFSTSIDLEQLFQEAEKKIDQIVQAKKDIREETEQSSAAPVGTLEQDLTKELTFAEELERIQKKYTQLEFEFKNYIERTEKQLQLVSEQVSAQLLKEMLEIIDIFDFARNSFSSGKISHSIESYQKGFAMLHKHFFDLLGKIGLQKVEAEGQPFDPMVHQAVAAEEVENCDHQVILKEIKTGYMYRDILLRPSLVKVALPIKKQDEKPSELQGSGENK